MVRCAAAMATGEERVLAIKREWADGTLDGVRINLDAAVLEETA